MTKISCIIYNKDANFVNSTCKTIQFYGKLILKIHLIYKTGKCKLKFAQTYYSKFKIISLQKIQLKYLINKALQDKSTKEFVYSVKSS